MAYIKDINNNDVRSEGMSYGMMIAVQLDKKAEFDAIWNWSKTYMYHNNPEHPAYRYFAWSMKTDGTANDEMPAPDGEEYFTTALYFAHARWGSGSGIYNYKEQADQLLKDMLHRETITGPTKTGILTGLSIFDRQRKLVRFTPDKANANRTDPSYHLPAFYEIWAICGPKADRKFWSEAADASRDFLQSAAHPVTGLSSDYANFDATPWSSPWNPTSELFQYDSWRTVMNLACDWNWWAKDNRIPGLCDRIQAFFENQGIETYGNRYTIDGKLVGNDHNTGIVAMNAVAGLAASHPQAKEFTQALWDTEIPTGKYRYYDGMLYMLAMLHCSGNFQIWLPTAP